MKKWWSEYKFVCIAVFFWKIGLLLVEQCSVFFPTRPGYFGPIPWTNFDGIHYLRIAQEGYFQYGEAFFPLYPLLIRFIHSYTLMSMASIGVCISFFSFFIGLLMLYSILKKQSKSQAQWTVVFLLVFPTSFFFTSAYSEGLFFLFAISSWYFVQKEAWILSVIMGAFASATRLYGIFLIIPLFGYFIADGWKKNTIRFLLLLLVPVGLISYMYFLFIRTGDPLYFFHAQPAFGANRSGSTFIILPQVFWRYGKIIFTAFLQPTPVSYIISVFEFISTILGLWVVWIGWKMKINIWLLLYALTIIIVPSLTGTLSSMPRYLLCAFPLFIILGMLDNTRIKIGLAIVFGILESVAVTLFLRGWFVS